MPLLKPIVKPSDFRLRLVGSGLRNRERELVAENIIIISKEKGDSWFDFSFDDYWARCGNRVTSDSKAILNEFAQNGFLSLGDRKYSVTEKFIRILAEYIKEE